MTEVKIGFSALVLLAGSAPALADCANVPGPCTVPMGEYHITLPEGDGPFPALMMLHGAGGRGEGMVNMLAGAATARGYAVIGPQGVRDEMPFGSTWAFVPEYAPQRDDTAFLEEVIVAAVSAFNIDRQRILLAGYSVGGSMVSVLACDDPALARAYAPVAGGFWRPQPRPDDCGGAVDLFQTHGWADGMVPIEGRGFPEDGTHQGDVFADMEIWRGINGCHRSAPDDITNEGDYWLRAWTSCEAGSLQFALHPGGHAVPRGWVDMALDWFEGL